MTLKAVASMNCFGDALQQSLGSHNLLMSANISEKKQIMKMKNVLDASPDGYQQTLNSSCSETKIRIAKRKFCLSGCVFCLTPITTCANPLLHTFVYRDKGHSCNPTKTSTVCKKESHLCHTLCPLQ